MTPDETPRTVVRDATADDATACAAVYAPYVLATPATFEHDPPGDDETARRIATAQEHHAWLVLEDGGEVVGFAYGGTFRPRPSYRWTCETTIYLAAGATGRGGGRRLYAALLERLAAHGLLTAAAVVALPNPASEHLHAALGFERVGVFPGSAGSSVPGTTSRGSRARWARDRARASRRPSLAEHPTRHGEPALDRSRGTPGSGGGPPGDR